MLIKTAEYQVGYTEQQIKELRVTLLYDSLSFLRGLRTGWGFSCLFEIDDMRLLFDTGSGGGLDKNMISESNFYENKKCGDFYERSNY